MKRTEGEWKIEVGSYPNGYFLQAVVDEQEAEGNAKLMAAAPELLEALTTIYTVFKNAGFEAGGHYKDYLLKAKAAIKKAT